MYIDRSTNVLTATEGLWRCTGTWVANSGEAGRDHKQVSLEWRVAETGMWKLSITVFFKSFHGQRENMVSYFMLLLHLWVFNGYTVFFFLSCPKRSIKEQQEHLETYKDQRWLGAENVSLPPHNRWQWALSKRSNSSPTTRRWALATWPCEVSPTQSRARWADSCPRTI